MTSDPPSGSKISVQRLQFEVSHTPKLLLPGSRFSQVTRTRRMRRLYLGCKVMCGRWTVNGGHSQARRMEQREGKKGERAADDENDEDDEKVCQSSSTLRSAAAGPSRSTPGTRRKRPRICAPAALNSSSLHAPAGHSTPGPSRAYPSRRSPTWTVPLSQPQAPTQPMEKFTIPRCR